MTIAVIPSVSTRTLSFHRPSSSFALETLVPLIEVVILEVFARAWFHMIAFRTFIERHVGVMGILPRGGLPIILFVLVVGLDGYDGIPAYSAFEFEVIGFYLFIPI